MIDVPRAGPWPLERLESTVVPCPSQGPGIGIRLQLTTAAAGQAGPRLLSSHLIRSDPIRSSPPLLSTCVSVSFS